MELEITRVERQKESASRWRYARGIGTLALTPRFGKTYLAIEFIINAHLNNNADNYVIIVVPSDIIFQQWVDNLKSYCEHIERVELYTINNIVTNDLHLSCTLLIVDEIQKFTTPDRKECIDGTRIKHTYRLALTGTYPYGIQWIEELYPVVDTISEEEAVNNKWISPFVEYNILLELPIADKARYERFSKPISETLQLFRQVYPLLKRENNEPIFTDEFHLIQSCHSGFKTISLAGHDIYVTYDRLCNTIALLQGWHTNLDVSIPVNEELHKVWSPIAIHERAKVFIDYIRRRNDILIDNPVKLQIIGDIVSRNNVTTICFNESTKFADSVAEYINARFKDTIVAACYHSKIDSRTMINPATNDYFKFTTGDRKGLPKILGKESIKRIVIDGVKEGYYKFLSTAKALDEGLDIPNIEQVICTGGTTNPLTYQQRTARGKTIDIYNPSKMTRIFNLVFDDFTNSSGELIKSRDKTKLILRQQSSGATVKWIKNTSEINLMVAE